jgi:hypothetical protein
MSWPRSGAEPPRLVTSAQGREKLGWRRSQPGSEIELALNTRATGSTVIKVRKINGDANNDLVE